MSRSVAEAAVVLRRKLCPKTSYASAGKAAATLFVLDAKMSAWKALSDLIIQTKEFDNVEVFDDLNKLPEDAKSGVLLVVDGPHDLAVYCQLLEQHRLKLALVLTTHAHLSAATGEQVRVEQVVCSETSLVALHLVRRQAHPAAGFNGQPSVQSRQQFRYLWAPVSHDIDKRAEGKLRVLQRLADHALADGRKLGADDWDASIQHLLRNPDTDDWAVYSHIRKITLGSSLEEDLGRLAPAVPSGGHGASSGGVDNEGGDGRANYLVDLSIKCLPERLRDAPHAVNCLLDYGCAEGALTAELGRRLGLAEHQIYGADVRSITAHPGYRFLQLPAEKADGVDRDIMPQLADHSVDLITSAMVFHHVEHIDEALRELRRKIRPNGVLVIREHDCHSVAMGVVLDVIHGLFSLAWSQPIEWPDFVEEYQAFYRSRETWTQLLQASGFRRLIEPGNVDAAHQFGAAVRSEWHHGRKRFPNVTRAYYAVYEPDPTRPPPPRPAAPAAVPSTSSTAVKALAADPESAGSASEGRSKKRARFSSALEASDEVVVVESTSYPGRFYEFNPRTQATQWISRCK